MHRWFGFSSFIVLSQGRGLMESDWALCELFFFFLFFSLSFVGNKNKKWESTSTGKSEAVMSACAMYRSVSNIHSRVYVCVCVCICHLPQWVAASFWLLGSDWWRRWSNCCCERWPAKLCRGNKMWWRPGQTGRDACADLLLPQSHSQVELLSTTLSH